MATKNSSSGGIPYPRYAKKKEVVRTAAQERLREKRWRRNRYHLVASQCKNSVDDEDSYLHHILESQRGSQSPISASAHDTKMRLLHELAVDHGDTQGDGFRRTLDELTDLHTLADWDARDDPKLGGMSTDRPILEGTWITLSKPNFQGCLGQNSHGEYLYSLGRMAWDMFCPTDLVCSIQGSFNQVDTIPLRERSDLVDAVPKSLSKEIKNGDTVLRSYNIITAFTIEAHDSKLGHSCSNRNVRYPIKGIMTSFGYCLPDPTNPTRLSVWFTGGSIEINDDFDLDQWRAIFGEEHLTKRKMSGRARVFAAKVMMGAHPPEETGGMDDDGTISFTLNRPIGGHGSAYVDVLYMDSNMRVIKSQTGTVYAFARIPK